MSKQQTLIDWLLKRGAVQIGSSVWTDAKPNDIDFIVMGDVFNIMMKNIIKHKINHTFNDNEGYENKLLNIESVKIFFGNDLPVNVLSYHDEISFNKVKTANELMLTLANKPEYSELFRNKIYRTIFFENFVSLLRDNGVG
jgi:hypothetical protein